MSRSSRREQRLEAKRLLGIPLTWEDELPLQSEELPPPSDGEDGFFGGCGLRPYLPETGVDEPDADA